LIEPIWLTSPRLLTKIITMYFWRWRIRSKILTMKNSIKVRTSNSKNYKVVGKIPTIIVVFQCSIKVSCLEIRFRVLELIFLNCRTRIKRIVINLYCRGWNSRLIFIVSRRYRHCCRRIAILWRSIISWNIRISSMIKNWLILRFSSSRWQELGIEKKRSNCLIK